MDWLGIRILQHLHRIERKVMATQADLDTALAALATQITAIETAVASLVAKITALGTPVDLTAEVNQINAATSSIQAAVAAIPPADLTP